MLKSAVDVYGATASADTDPTVIAVGATIVANAENNFVFIDNSSKLLLITFNIVARNSIAG